MTMFNIDTYSKLFRHSYRTLTYIYVILVLFIHTGDGASWLTQPPVTPVVCEGSNFTLDWTFDGTSLVASWYKDNVEIASLFTMDITDVPTVKPAYIDKYRIVGSMQDGSAKLGFINVDSSHAGQYNVSVTVTEDSTRILGMRTVNAITVAPTDLTVSGSGQSWSCNLTSAGSPAAAEAQLYWKKISDSSTIAGPSSTLGLQAPSDLTGDYACCMNGTSVSCYPDASSSDYCLPITSFEPTTTTKEPTTTTITTTEVTTEEKTTPIPTTTTATTTTTTAATHQVPIASALSDGVKVAIGVSAAIVFIILAVAFVVCAFVLFNKDKREKKKKGHAPPSVAYVNDGFTNNGFVELHNSPKHKNVNKKKSAAIDSSAGYQYYPFSGNPSLDPYYSGRMHQPQPVKQKAPRDQNLAYNPYFHTGDYYSLERNKQKRDKNMRQPNRGNYENLYDYI